MLHHINGIPIYSHDFTKTIPNPELRTHRKKRIQKKWNKGVSRIIVVPDTGLVIKHGEGLNVKLIMHPVAINELRRKCSKADNFINAYGLPIGGL